MDDSMSKQLRALQAVLGICVAVLAFYLLREIDYYGAAGIGILWGLAAFLGVQALNEWSRNRNEMVILPKGHAADGAPDAVARDKDASEAYPIKDWTNIKSSLYMLKLNLEDMDDPSEKKRLAHDCIAILKRYEDIISKYGDHIPDDENMGVLEDIKYCSSVFQEK